MELPWINAIVACGKFRFYKEAMKTITGGVIWHQKTKALTNLISNANSVRSLTAANQPPGQSLAGAQRPAVGREAKGKPARIQPRLKEPTVLRSQPVAARLNKHPEAAAGPPDKSRNRAPSRQPAQPGSQGKAAVGRNRKPSPDSTK